MVFRARSRSELDHDALLRMLWTGMHDAQWCLIYARRTALSIHLRQQAGCGGLDAVKGELHFIPLPAAPPCICQVSKMMTLAV